MRLAYVIFLFFSLIFFHSFSQSDSTRKKYQLIFNFDSRQSFISSSNKTIYDIVIFGAKLGVDYKSKIRVGLGYYDMFHFLKIPYRYQNQNYTLDIHFRYAAVYAEYVWFHNYRWDISSPVLYGYSFTTVRKSLAHKEALNSRMDHYHLIEPCLYASYRIWKWIGIGTGVGYRFMLNEQDVVKNYFNNPMWLIKLRIYPKELFKPSCKVSFK